MKRQSTKKLFFRKYPYKVEMFCKGASLIRVFGIDQTQMLCTSDTFQLHAKKIYYTVDKKIDKVELYNFVNSVKPFLEKNLKFRAEGNWFKIFTEDLETANQIVEDCKKWTHCLWAPANDTELKFLTDNNRKVIVDALPHGKFTHKIVFKSNWTQTKGANFINWLEKYPKETYSVPQTTYRYLTGKLRYAQDPFIYISEPKMLTMLTLFAGESIKFTEEFVPRHTLLL